MDEPVQQTECLIGISDQADTMSPPASPAAPAAWSKDRALEFLSSGYWFRELSSELQRAIIAAGEIKQVRRGALYRIGAKVDGLYATLEGDVRFYGEDGKRGRAFVRALGPTSWFGAIPLINAEPRRTFEAWCASPATVFFLGSDAYRTLTEDSQEAYRAFVRLMYLHSRQVARMMLDARAEAPLRTVHALIHLAHAQGRMVNDESRDRNASFAGRPRIPGRGLAPISQ